MCLSVRRLVASFFAVAVGVLVFASAPALASPEVLAPVTVGPVGATKAFVHGVLNPRAEGSAGTYEFLFNASKTECRGGASAPTSIQPPGIVVGFEGEEVTRELTGVPFEPGTPASQAFLNPETYYSVCLVEHNLRGEEVAASPPFVFKTPPLLEAPETGEPVAGSVTSSSVKLQGTLNPGKPGQPGTYEFVYRQSFDECQRDNPATNEEETEFATPAEDALGDEKEVVPTTPVEVSGLSPDLEYTACLLVRNEVGETAVGKPVTFTTRSEKPSISNESVVGAGATSATVSATISRGGPEASYRVQYGTSSDYGSETTPVGISFSVPQTVPVQLTGLQPGTEYHFRFVATNREGTVDGSDISFTTYPPEGSSMPNGRIVEQVSHFAIPLGEADWPSSSPDGSLSSYLPFDASAEGNSVTFAGTPSVGGSARNGEYGNEYLASRAPDGGWSQTNIIPLSDERAEFQAFSSDLSTGAVKIEGMLPPFVASEAPIEESYTELKTEQNYNVLYVRAFDESKYRPLFSMTPPTRIGNKGTEFDANVAAISPDSTHVLFEANDRLVEDRGTAEQELREDTEKESRESQQVFALDLEEQNLYTEYQRDQEENRHPEEEIKAGEAEAKGKEYKALREFYGGSDNRSELYVSVDGQPSLVNISPTGTLLPNASYGGTHEISADDSRIFWTSQENPKAVFVRENGSSTVQVSQGQAEFVTASTDGKYAFYIEAEKLWRFDVENGARIELAGSGGGVQSMIGTNETGEDGAYVYFVAHEVLTTQPNAAKQSAVEGEDNLYAYEPGPGVGTGGSRIAFIATLPGVPSAYMTPDGDALAFSSSLNLTGHPYPDEGSEEVYVYDAENSSLFCASCRAQASGGNLVSGHRWVSENGDQVFFNSEAPLVANDIDGTRDVYEWERDGSGACTEVEGCVYLLSGGIEGAAGLLDASASGNDVFMVTRQRLVSEGQNENVEVYDARVDGVLTVAAPQCSGTGCQGAPAPAPIFATPASVTFAGVGNFPQPTSRPSTTPKTLTRAQKLSRALKECLKKHKRKARMSCESKAQKLYGTKTKTKKSTERKGR